MNAYLREFWTDKRVLFISFEFLLALAISIATPGAGLGRSAPWFVGGIVFFFFAEYLIHRFILHGILRYILPPAYKGHVLHHARPTDMEWLLTPNVYNIPSYAAVWLIVWLITRDWHATSTFIAGTSCYQVYYEWTHYVSHRPIIPKTPWGRWMKKFHLLHHYKNPHYWYGVTHPTMDVLFGTHVDWHNVQTERTAEEPGMKHSEAPAR
ncbi:MAG: sterol desaturase family protein [Thermoflavifilum sp.]|nr:sterol desaturase family protein [Thermoflavifilum sp.]MCL6514450.1 sterol desaturase family protein [Alicyclobacillus sp.]